MSVYFSPSVALVSISLAKSERIFMARNPSDVIPRGLIFTFPSVPAPRTLVRNSSSRRSSL